MQTALLLGTNPKARGGKRPSSFYMARIKATEELYKHGKFKQLIISGDKRKGYDEPQTMRHDLIERGVPDSIITMDGQGYRTLLSMRNIKQHFRVNDMIIISQNGTMSVASSWQTRWILKLWDIMLMTYDIQGRYGHI